jgi:uroporphyrin-III C-methyltransferase/precorrin-2 dehydrogenase/sirohydrochlorin ferrochelatase
MDPTTPITIASSVTRENQQTWHGHLDSLEQGITKVGFDNPVLIGIGRVFGQIRQDSLKNDFPAAAYGQ